jgi:suppressor for copper-sensitivity B
MSGELAEPILDGLDCHAFARNDDNANAEVSKVYYVLMAFFGGIILNFMPCVLPVVGMKMRYFQNMSGDSIKIHALICIAGIVTYFMSIASFVIMAKISGEYYAFGINLQNSRFVSIVALIITAMISVALNRVTIQLPNQVLNILSIPSVGYIGTFISSIATAVLGTPCAAPLLTSSIAFVSVAPVWEVFTIYMVAAMGFSMPYIILLLCNNCSLAFVSLGKTVQPYIQKSTVILLSITVIWLLYIIYKQLGYMAVIFLFSMCILSKYIVEYDVTNSNKLYLYLAQKRYVILILIFICTPIIITRVYNNQRYIEDYKHGMWDKFSMRKMSDAFLDGDVVLIDATADWCITCKYNKFMVLDTILMAQFLRERNVKCFRIDITSDIDDDASKFLQLNHVAGVPYNVIYGPNAKDGIVMPVIYTRDDIKQAVMNAK